MAKKESKLEKEQKQVEKVITQTNIKIEQLGKRTSQIHQALNNLQVRFDVIRNVPSENYLKLADLKKVRLKWKGQVDKIERDYKNATMKSAGTGAAGASTGVAVAALGPSAAMGLATTFGVASTGTAVSTLSGAAATNAALAWLGGGALTAGGGGMAAGNILLGLAGPVGWTIAGAALLGSGLLFWRARSTKERLDNVFSLISQRDKKSYQLANIELDERMLRIEKETEMLLTASKKVQTFGEDYEQMTEKEQYELGSYVNLMNSATQLLVNPILGVQPKYSEEDFDDYMSSKKEKYQRLLLDYDKKMIIGLANLLYKISLDQEDKKLLWKTFRKNKEFLESMNVTKKEFDLGIMEKVSEALEYKYQTVGD